MRFPSSTGYVAIEAFEPLPRSFKCVKPPLQELRPRFSRIQLSPAGEGVERSDVHFYRRTSGHSPPPF